MTEPESKLLEEDISRPLFNLRCQLDQVEAQDLGSAPSDLGQDFFDQVKWLTCLKLNLEQLILEVECKVADLILRFRKFSLPARIQLALPKKLPKKP